MVFAKCVSISRSLVDAPASRQEAVMTKLQMMEENMQRQLETTQEFSGSRVEDLWKAKNMFFCNFFGLLLSLGGRKNNWSFVIDNWKIANNDVWRGWWILYPFCGIQFIRAIGRSIFYIHVAKYFTTWNPPEFPQPVIYLVSPSSLYFHLYQGRFPKD